MVAELKSLARLRLADGRTSIVSLCLQQRYRLVVVKNAQSFAPKLDVFAGTSSKNFEATQIDARFALLILFGRPYVPFLLLNRIDSVRYRLRPNRCFGADRCGPRSSAANAACGSCSHARRGHRSQSADRPDHLPARWCFAGGCFSACRRGSCRIDIGASIPHCLLRPSCAPSLRCCRQHRRRIAPCTGATSWHCLDVELWSPQTLVGPYVR